MVIANTDTYDARRPGTIIPGIAARAIAGRPKRPEGHTYSPGGDGRSEPPCSTAWQVREEPAYYIPDLLPDKDREAEPELFAAADAHSEGLREAMALLDEAENLVAVLMASTEHQGDSRAMQAEAVLKIVKKKLTKAHTRIDRQHARHRNLFLAYFALKARSEKGGE
jgi:hypothetical protein